MESSLFGNTKICRRNFSDQDSQSLYQVTISANFTLILSGEPFFFYLNLSMMTNLHMQHQREKVYSPCRMRELQLHLEPSLHWCRGCPFFSRNTLCSAIRQTFPSLCQSYSICFWPLDSDLYSQYTSSFSENTSVYIHQNSRRYLSNCYYSH